MQNKITVADFIQELTLRSDDPLTDEIVLVKQRREGTTMHLLITGDSGAEAKLFIENIMKVEKL